MSSSSLGWRPIHSENGYVSVSSRWNNVVHRCVCHHGIAYDSRAYSHNSGGCDAVYGCIDVFYHLFPRAPKHKRVLRDTRGGIHKSGIDI
uniref:Uncharacterized protein n=1 Tax=Moniliophthora roreri TaxID=221103 RepID=A0A0W0G9B0_MONRR